MSDDIFGDVYDDNTYEQPNQGGPKALRDAYESEKQARKALEDRLAAIEADSKKAKLATALKGIGVNPDALGDAINQLDPDTVADQAAAWKKALGLQVEEAPQGISDEQAQQIAGVTGEPSGTAPVAPGSDADRLAGIDNEADFAKLMGWQ